MPQVLKIRFQDVDWRSWPESRHSIAFLIIGFTLLRLVLAALLPVLSQEAYYWSWSRHLEWSYFDHPPLASYAIGLTTALLGQTSFGIKTAAALWALGWNLMWLRLVLDMYGDRRVAFWSLAALNLTLLYGAASVSPTPDGPLLFAWIGAVWAIWRLSASGDGRWWFVAGAFLGLSWLGKYAGVLLLPVAFLYLLVSPGQRHWLRKPQPYLAALLALVIFAPVLYWNAQHDWASFTFQGRRRLDEMSGLRPRYFVALLVTQFILVTPYLFVMSLAALGRGARAALSGRLDDRSRLLLLSAAVPIVLFTFISFRSLVKLNWLIPAFWALIILGTRHLLTLENGPKRLLRGLASSAALMALGGVVMMTALLPLKEDLDNWSGFDRTAAWVDKASADLKAEGVESFVFSPNYKISSLMRFHLAGQPRTYAQDIYGQKALQFDYFPLPDDRLKGQTGFFISNQPASDLYVPSLKVFFDDVDLIHVVEIKSFGRITREIRIYRCTNYKGHPRRHGRPLEPAND